MNKFEKTCIKNAGSLDELAKMLCAYGYFDLDGVPIEKIIKYLYLGREYEIAKAKEFCKNGL